MKRKLILALCLVAGVANAQTFVVNNLQINGTVSALNAIPLTALAQQAANTVVANASGIPASPTAVPVPSCSGTGSGLQWIAGTGFSCGSFQPSSQFPASPYAYGAVGNGVTDDTAALQSWITAIGSTGQSGYCAPGTYKITKTLLFAGNSTKISGPGGNACAITPSMPGAPTVSSATAGATYNPGAATSIRLTVSSTANIVGAVEVSGVTGTTEANGAWPAVVIDSTHVDIVGPAFAHAWVSGGQINFPAIALVPTTTPNTAAQPTLDLAGIYLAPPVTNAGNTDAAIITGGAFNSPGSSVIIHDMVENGYRTGFMFWQSFDPVFRNVFFYNNQSAAIVANQDISFSNALLDHAEFFSNGNTFSQPAVNIGGSVFVENPSIISSQFSGNFGGILLAGNVNGAVILGNYLENNSGYNLSCGNTTLSFGAQIQGNFFNYNSGTNVTDLSFCNNALFSGNWLSNQTFTLGIGTVALNTQTFTGTGGLNYPSGATSSIIHSTVTAAAITSAVATNVTSLSVGSGNWACTGSTFTNPAGTTTQSFNATALSTTSAGFPNTVGEVTSSTSTPAGISVGQTTGTVYESFAGPTTLYLVGQVNYATSTLTINGDIHCIRVF